MVRFIGVLACVLLLCAGAMGGLPSRKVYPYVLGETRLNITVLVADGQYAKQLHFLNVHQNENTSVVAARALLYFYGGSITLLEHTGDRLISFALEGTTYSFDPNRMFTPRGVEATLRQNGPYSPNAARLVLAFGQHVLQVYDFDNEPRAIVLHNNGPNYDATLYLPGGPYEDEAELVFIAPGSSPRDFFFITERSLFLALKNQGLNAVLQQSASAPTDDGSLSVYAYLKNKPYINVEAAAADDGEGAQVVVQLDMLYRMLRLIINQ